eukprot:353200-Chlamydomonas_euryale.AAC.11
MSLIQLLNCSDSRDRKASQKDASAFSLALATSGLAASVSARQRSGEGRDAEQTRCVDSFAVAPSWDRDCPPDPGTGDSLRSNYYERCIATRPADIPAGRDALLAAMQLDSTYRAGGFHEDLQHSASRRL